MVLSKNQLFHVTTDEYEFFIEPRKICRRSVSLPVAVAADRYSGKLIDIDERIVKKDVDTLFKHRVLRRIAVDGAISRQIYWGFPIEYLKTLRL